MSLIGALSIGKTALATSQAALQVTGNNIANAGNPDYTRQVAKLVANGDQFSNQSLLIGTGVNLDSITRQIDEALQNRLRASISDSESGDVMQQWMGRVESVFNELGDEDLSTELSKFFNSWSNLANKPQDVGLRQVVAQNADSLGKWFNNLSGQLDSLQSDVNSRITAQVADADALATRVANLNQQIIITEGSGQGQANGLRDQRDAVINQLSQIMDIKTVPQANGATNIYIGSVPLVTNAQSRGVGTKNVIVGDQVQTQVIFKSDNSTMEFRSGSLGALLGVRSEINDTIKSVDSLANNLMFEVNKLHSSGQGTKPRTSITSTNAVDDINVALNDTAKTGLDFKPTNGSFVIHVREKSTGYETSTLVQVDLDGLNGNDTTLASLATQLDGIDGISATTNGGKLQITADPNAFDFTFSQDSSGVLATLGMNTMFTGENAADMKLDAGIAADPTLLAAAKNGQPADNQTALAIAALESQAMSGLNGQSLKGAYQAMINTVAVNASDAKTNAEAATVVKETLMTQRESMSGVSLDEEAVNLMRQQRAFQAASRLISVVDEMMKTVLGMI